MLVTYVAPNRSWHYTYAKALAKSGHLQRFVCGFPRISPRAPIPELGSKLLRRDHIQIFYLASLRFGLPHACSEELTYLSKIWLDVSAKKDALKSDVFLFYSGAGLSTEKALKSTRTVGVIEAVNTHVLVQREILREECERLKLPLRGFHPREVARRVREFELADGVICPSAFTRQSFIDQGIPADRIRVVPFGADFPARNEQVKQPTDVFRVLYVGQINVRKGLRYLFQAFEKFKHPQKELWIVGPKTEQTGIEDMAPPEGTRFLGVLKGEALEKAYRSCHVFVLPTIEEGLALVIGEALSHGLPVIATANSGAADLFEDDIAGFIVPIRSPEAIAGKLQLLADDRKKHVELSAAALSPSRGQRSWEMAGQDLVDSLKAIAAMPKL